MKKLFLLLLTTLTLSCCDNDDDSTTQLPPATQTGANTVGCLVNGQAFLPHAEGINPAVVCNYEYIDSEFFFTLRFSDLENGSNEGIRLRTQRIDLEENYTYLLNKNYEDDGDYSGGGGEYQDKSSNEYFTNQLKTGELIITRVDLSNSIISGTFWFDAINEEGEIVEIREGRFDMQY